MMRIPNSEDRRAKEIRSAKAEERDYGTMIRICCGFWPGRRAQRSNCRPVAQICNLPYRRFEIGKPLERPKILEYEEPADCNSAIQQIANLRYQDAGPDQRSQL